MEKESEKTATKITQRHFLLDAYKLTALIFLSHFNEP